MQDRYDVAIVGGGHAGAQAAIVLRQAKFEGSIAIFGDEIYPPYERPPLSKEYLSGEKTFERIMLRPENFWAERDIDLVLGSRVARVDAANRKIMLANDSEVGFGKLIWAAGGSPRMLPCEGAEAPNVFAVRRRKDVDAIMDMLDSVNNVVVVGGGYIGLEAAAVFGKLGKKVTVLEALDRVLSRVAGETLSRFFEGYHRSKGVDVRVDTKLSHFVTDESGKAIAVELEGGERVPADLVIVGIGIIPDVGPLLSAGATGGNGVDVDEHCRTSLPGIYAVGDCAVHGNKYADGTHIRLESVQNANDQAKTAAMDIAGKAAPYDAVPWFWSNQYDLRLQTVGLSTGFDREVVRGDPDSASFSVVYLRGGKVIALDCVNSTKDYVQGRKMVVEGLTPDLDELADSSKPLKEVSVA